MEMPCYKLLILQFHFWIYTINRTTNERKELNINEYNKQSNERICTKRTHVYCYAMMKTEESQASQVSDDIVKVIDWNNSALMHKGLSWIAKNYLMKRNMM